jgi:hypothetical protein
MPIDPAMLAKSLGTLNDLDPIRDLAATLQQAVRAAKQLFDADADGNLHWASASDQRAQALEDNQEIFAAGPCAEAYTTGQPAVMHDATMEQRWGEIAPDLRRGPDRHCCIERSPCPTASTSPLKDDRS